jgi:hypothetical protein
MPQVELENQDPSVRMGENFSCLTTTVVGCRTFILLLLLLFIPFIHLNINWYDWWGPYVPGALE